jgi:hypothetical protein
MCPRILKLFLAVAVALGAIGCSNEAERGINKDKDKPKPADKK